MRCDLADPAGRSARRRALLALVTALTLGPALGACSTDEYVAPPPTAATEIADPAAAATTLASLERAIDVQDATGAAALGADDTTGTLLSDAVRNAAAIDLDDVTFTYITETGVTRGNDAWSALVAVTWRVDGFDEASARIEMPFSFASGGREIAAVGGDAARLPVWLSGPVRVSRTDATLVLGVGSQDEIDQYGREFTRAVQQARAVLGGSDRVVVEVPADAGALDRALGVTDGTYGAIAAVTAPVDGSRTERSPVHVFVNPRVHDGMDPTAAQVVATHEVVHAVTGAVLAQRAPLWLVEGFADYVALRDTGLPITRTAGQVIDLVDEEGVPETLPADSAFAPSAGHLGVVYEEAWQVAVTLAEQAGEQALVDLYRSVVAGADLVTELQRHVGWSEADLTAAWQDRLARLG